MVRKVLFCLRMTVTNPSVQKHLRIAVPGQRNVGLDVEIQLCQEQRAKQELMFILCVTDG